MPMRDIEGAPPPEPGGVTVTYVSPGGVACMPFADGFLAMRVCLGHVDHAEDGLAAEADGGAEPVPWASRAARDEAEAALRRRAGGAEGDRRESLLRLADHVRGAPYYEAR